MSLKSFRTYENAVLFYNECEKLRLPRHFQEQLLRASASIALNLSEGSAKPTAKDRTRFYYIALGSFRESKTILDLARIEESSRAQTLAHELGGQLYKLCKSSSKISPIVPRRVP